MLIEKSKMSAPPPVPCKRFIQNAWKKDYCSNCFKPKEEHVPVKHEINTEVTWSLNDMPPPPSILKQTSNKIPLKGSCVTFNSQESEVIGYGGNDEFSDDDDDFFDENPKYEGEDLADTEYEKELQKLTKSNTDFNSVIENLNKHPSDLSQPFSPLKLGRPDLNQLNKKPVQISVQQYGAPAKPTNKLCVKPVPASHNNVKSSTLTDGSSSEHSKRIVTAAASSVVSKEVSSSENSSVNTTMCPSTIPSSTSVVTSSISNPPATVTVSESKTVNINVNSTSSKPRTEPSPLNTAKSVKLIAQSSESSESSSPPKLTTWKTLSNEKTVPITKTDASTKMFNEESMVECSSKRNEVPVEHKLGGQNELKRNNSETSSEGRARKCLQRGNIITKSHEIVKSKIVQQNKDLGNDTLDSLIDTSDYEIMKAVKETEDKTDINAGDNVTNIHVVPTAGNKHFDSKDTVTTRSTLLKKELMDKLNSVFGKHVSASKSDIPTSEAPIIISHEVKEGVRLDDWVSVEQVECASSSDSEPNNELNLAKDDLSDTPDIYNCDREKIGEPDGKADSDSSEHSEPLALNKQPQPSAMEDISTQVPPPRSSFLHNRKPKSDEVIDMKPKIGVKPNGLLYSIPQQFSSPTTKLNGFHSGNNNSKDIKINSLKIQSNYAEQKKKSADIDSLNFSNSLSNGRLDAVIGIYKKSAETNSGSTYTNGFDKKLPEPEGTKSLNITSSNDPKHATSSEICQVDSAVSGLIEKTKDMVGTVCDSQQLPNTVDSNLSDPIDSKIIFDREYDSIAKSLSDHHSSEQSFKSSHGALEHMDAMKCSSSSPDDEFKKIYNRSFSCDDKLTPQNFSDAIDRLNGLEEKFNPLFDYQRSRSNSCDDSFSDCVTSRCESPEEMRPKRQAPMPPPTPPMSSHKANAYATPIRKTPSVNSKPESDIVTPPPRKSSSTDCLSDRYSNSEKFTKKIGSSTTATRMRHTLKKLLRLGKEDGDFPSVLSPAPKPRPQIIHPIDLNKSGVEVLRNNKENDQDSAANNHHVKARPSKPPPPPRSHSLIEVFPYEGGDAARDYENVDLINNNKASAVGASTFYANLTTALPDMTASNVTVSSNHSTPLTPCSSYLSPYSHTYLTTSMGASAPSTSSDLSLPYFISSASSSGEPVSVSSPILVSSPSTPDLSSLSFSQSSTSLSSSVLNSSSNSVTSSLTSSPLSSKPARPPPPKSAEFLKRLSTSLQVNLPSSPQCVTTTPSTVNKNEESRGSPPPNPTPPVKPQRTASLRDQKKLKSNPDYEVVQGSHESAKVSPETTSEVEVLYEPLVINGNSGENDPPSPSSDGSSSGQRSLSYQYAGSETESDIYYPYVFCNNEEGSEEDGWKGRVRVRKSRNVVHKSLEDNYGAVVIANHEALAQVLEQMNHNFITTPALYKPIKTLSSLRFRDLKLFEDSKLSIGGRKYYISQFDSLHAIVSLCKSQISFLHTKSLPPCFVLTPICEFVENIPSKFVSNVGKDCLEQASVAILPCSKVCTLPMYTKNCSNINSENNEKDLGLILIQLVNAVKSLQACGIEETTEALEEFLLCQEDKNLFPRLCVLPVSDENTNRISLCQCVSKAIDLLLPLSKFSSLLKSILAHEKSTSLSQTKSVIEFWLWGPDDVNLNGDKQVALQRWLDLDRATTLHSLVCSRPPQLSPQDYSHLLFLVRTSSKHLLEASNILLPSKTK